MKAAYLKPGQTIVVKGERIVIREVAPGSSKDRVMIRIRGRKPLYDLDGRLLQVRCHDHEPDRDWDDLTTW